MDEATLLELVIRPMTEADVKQVHAIDLVSFSLPWTERSFHFEVSENPASRPWVAEAVLADGQRGVIGMLVMWLIVDEVHIGTIAVHPERRGKGIARRLLARALLSAQAEGVEKAFLEVRRSNLAAQKLYARFGFEMTDVRKRYYIDNNEDALLMTLEPLQPEALQRLVDAVG